MTSLYRTVIYCQTRVLRAGLFIPLWRVEMAEAKAARKTADAKVDKAKADKKVEKAVKTCNAEKAAKIAAKTAKKEAAPAKAPAPKVTGTCGGCKTKK